MKNYTHAIKNAIKICDAWLPLKIQYDQVPGLAVGIVYKGELVYQRGFGYADVERKIPVTPETCFRIASISKTFTAVAIMQLVEQRKIRLSDAVSKYLPWFKTEERNLGDITIHQLLSHTGGVFRDGNTLHWETDKFPNLANLKKSVVRDTMVFKTPARFKYSNFGYALLGEIISVVTGEDYAHYVNVNIIKRLRMTQTAHDFTKGSDELPAKGYRRFIPGKPRHAFRPVETKAYAPATGFLSNIPDLAKYISALSLQPKKGSVSLIKRLSKKKMMRREKDTGEEGLWCGLGLFAEKIDDQEIVEYRGGFPGFISQISLDTKNDIAVIALMNSNNGSCSAISTGIFETIYGFMVMEKVGFDKKNSVVGYKNFEGLYRSRYNDYVVTGINGHLITFIPETDSPVENSHYLEQVRKNTFRMHGVSNFESVGEFTTFVFPKGQKRASGFTTGVFPYSRVDS